MSEIKVDTVGPRVDSGTLTIGAAGDTVNIAGTAGTGFPTPTSGIAASAIDSGTLADARIPDLNASKITAGTMATARLGSGTASSSTFLRGDQTYAEAGGGITGADQWRVPSDFTGQANPITSLERVDTFGFGGIGTALSEGSGSFTFPLTGIWLITANGFFFDNIDSRFNDIAIYTTTNNSSYNLASYASQFIQLTNSDNALASASCSFMFDVTNTTTHKCRFNVNVDETGVTTSGDSSANKTHFTFVRLGDT